MDRQKLGGWIWLLFWVFVVGMVILASVYVL